MIRILALTLLLLCLMPQAQAMAADAYALHKVNLRAGPDGGYPVVDILKRNERVELLGCIQGAQWCEVETRSGEHGWIFAQYLATTYKGQTISIIQSNGTGNLRITTFHPRNYWDTYYRKKYFYRDRDRWLPEDHNYHHDHNNDDDYHGHHGGGRPQQPPAPVKTEPKYKPMGYGKNYNPLCPMGEREC